MSLWQDVYTMAMNEEEAALLPARCRSMAARSALQETLRRADGISAKQIGSEMRAAVYNNEETVAQNEAKPIYAFPGSRAALHQVRPNW